MCNSNTSVYFEFTKAFWRLSEVLWRREGHRSAGFAQEMSGCMDDLILRVCQRKIESKKKKKSWFLSLQATKGVELQTISSDLLALKDEKKPREKEKQRWRDFSKCPLVRSQTEAQW